MANKPAPQKRRNNEKRKEKSRVAARCRRTKEMQIFNELTEALPARKEEVEQLDKASVMRLAISYLRVRDVVTLLPESQPAKAPLAIPKALEDISSEVSYMKALDGFVLVLSQQGDIVYCSENISEHLGVSQMEIMGQSVFEFSHPCDHDEVREALRSGGAGRRELLLRLKCTLTGKGRNVHLKSASYKVIHVTGHMLASPADEETSKQNKHGGDDPAKTNSDGGEKKNNSALVAVGRPIPHPSNIEVPFDNKTFLSKHSLDMKFTYTDDSLQNTLGFEPEELVGKSLYDYHHAGDTSALAQQFKSLFSKGQCETGQYRFLARNGGYAWVQTQATVITDKQQKPVSVVCINYVVSGIECKDEVFAPHQVQKTALSLKTPNSLAPVCVPSTDLSNGAIVAIIPPEDERPIPVTELIFAPRKKEMNKGFLMFSQDEGFTMFKDEPDDLTHLAPTAGDACIPLENSPFDMFDEFILNDNYCSLLGDDLANSSPVDSLNSDPLLMSSPEPLESDSSCERSSLLTELSLDRYDNTRSDGERDGAKSPFIPLSDDLPLLEPAVMWGALPDSVSLARPQPSEAQVTGAPALQRLLVAPPTGPPPQDLITNIYSDQGLLQSKNAHAWDTGVKRLMKQVEEPNPKRIKREPSPALAKIKPKPTQSSSVLMNLLDIPRQPPPLAPGLSMHRQILVPPNYQQMVNQKISQQQPFMARVHNPGGNSVILPHKSPPPLLDYRSNLSPLSLNVSPMGSLPSSPISYSPAISPARVEQNRSPYATPPSISPNARFYPVAKQPGVLQANQDPYLTNKMQTSPILYSGRSNLQTPIESLIDTTVASSPDFWTDAEMLQNTSDLLTALDDVKLV